MIKKKKKTRLYQASMYFHCYEGRIATPNLGLNSGACYHQLGPPDSPLSLVLAASSPQA